MADITAAAVQALRERTKLPLMKVKAALVEAGGDAEKAIEILRSQLGKLVESRSANETKEGRIFIATKPDGSEAAMVEIQCESAPVAGSEQIVGLGKALVDRVLNGAPLSSVEALMGEKAPDGRTFKEVFEEMLLQIREKIVVSRMAKVEGPVGIYLHHDGKTGVLFQAEGDNKSAPVLKDVAMHVAALKPTVARVEDVDPAKASEEREKLTAEAKASGKPENIVGKIVDGKMKVFYRDEAGVLAEQMFAKDDSKSVSQVLAEAGLKVKAFTLWVLGG
ncbi:Elongation factor Ts [Caulifigura coniformis]|uniref:Elongation factor Ts n=1 Tax=Caulifigura coniformis TaxID=2527983 RepID=A0A517SCV3_9PLAN|nr:translation elongation factor Ts [Caulifigura coniformis]QDT53949.1 Elongation factor Ts [Caulifigura coniformis]